MPDFITLLWNTLFFQPMLNGLILLYALLFHNFGLTIIAFTIIVRLIMLPLTLKQLHASKAMTQLQPEIARLQKRYANDKQRLSQEQMRLYKERGINPLGCAVPTLVQFPIWIGLYQSVLKALAATPNDLMELSRHLYSGLSVVHELVPLDSRFLWLDLALPDHLLIPGVGILPILVGASMWVQQKMSTMPTEDPRQQQMNQTMQWTMPIMFGFFTISFASGLAIYWVISNLISIVIQYFVTGWGSLQLPGFLQPARALSGVTSSLPATSASDETAEENPQTRQSDGKPRSKRKVSRRSR